MKTLATTAAMAAALIVGSPAGNGPRPLRSPAPIASGPPRFAFNGRDLTGFYPYTRFHHDQDPDGVFSVRDGQIRISGQEFGGLATRESFADYQLVVEWRWGSATWAPRRYRARNSGVMVHSVGPDGDALASWMASVECQILEGGTGDLLVVPGKQTPLSLSSEVCRGDDGQSNYRKGGQPRTLTAGRFNWWGRDPGWKDLLWFRGKLEPEAPHGQWNRMEVICDGDSIEYRLNGIVLNVATGARRSAGKILLQSEGAEIFFRRFEVLPLRK